MHSLLHPQEQKYLILANFFKNFIKKHLRYLFMHVLTRKKEASNQFIEALFEFGCRQMKKKTINTGRIK